MSSKSQYNSENDTSNRKVKEAAVEAVKKAMLRPTPSALVFGLLKEKDLNLKDMSPKQWKEIEKDIVDVLLSEVYPGEDISEDQLNFTSLIQAFGFMSNFIESLEANRVAKNGGADSASNEEALEEKKPTSGKTFEV